jgi:hypothetical protein
MKKIMPRKYLVKYKKTKNKPVSPSYNPEVFKDDQYPAPTKEATQHERRNSERMKYQVDTPKDQRVQWKKREGLLLVARGQMIGISIQHNLFVPKSIVALKYLQCVLQRIRHGSQHDQAGKQVNQL